MKNNILQSEEVKKIEIMEFRAGGNSYGIDINDIREIIPYSSTYTKVPNSHPYIEGIIMPRDFLVPIINIKECLKLPFVDEKEREMLIITSINGLNIGIHVDSVTDIHRSTTEMVTKPGRKLTTTVKKAVIGILKIEGRKIEILEFRDIITMISPEITFK